MKSYAYLCKRDTNRYRYRWIRQVDRRTQETRIRQVDRRTQETGIRQVDGKKQQLMTINNKLSHLCHREINV